MSDLIDRLCSTPDERRLLQREVTFMEATELVCEVMQEEGVTLVELAKRTNINPDYLASALDGELCISLVYLSDMLWAMGRGVKMMAEPLRKGR